MIALLLLLGCEPQEGERGYVECVTGPCDEVLICYEIVGDRGEAEYWIEGPESVRTACDGSDCADALQYADARYCTD